MLYFKQLIKTLHVIIKIHRDIIRNTADDSIGKILEYGILKTFSSNFKSFSKYQEEISYFQELDASLFRNSRTFKALNFCFQMGRPLKTFKF